MAQFIQVRGPDPDYKGLNRTMLLNVDAIVRIVPVFVEATNEANFTCTEDFKNASILCYQLVDVHGNEYSIGPGLLEKIGAAFDLAIPNANYKEGDFKNRKKRHDA